MSSGKGSKVIPIVVGLVLTLFVAGFMFITQVGISTGDGKKQIFDMKTKRIKTVTVDADLPEDTLATIAINSADIKDKFKDIEETNFEYKKKMQAMADTLKQVNETNRLLKEQLERQNRKMESVETAINNQPRTIDAETIKASVLGVLQNNLPDVLKTTPMGEMVGMPSDASYQVEEPKAEIDPKARVRIHSYGHSAPVSQPSAASTRSGRSTQQSAAGRQTPQVQNPYQYREAVLNHQSNTYPVQGSAFATSNRSRSVSAVPFQNKQQADVVVDPRFTIPPDAVLNDSVTITALIGRIPRDGDVNDPAPFKVAIGRDNLAANGFTMPGISGMIMSGIVYGDAVRQCVRTKILRATYIFEDGRILSLPKDRRSKTIIGYLADSNTGDPCIKGRYYTNKRAQITKSILANMAVGAANAYAETQVTNITNGQGGITRSVTGDNKKFVMGSAVASGANAVAAQLARQEFDQWDQVVVPVGRTVTIHIDQQLEIDNSSTLRKLVYDNENSDYGLTD